MSNDHFQFQHFMVRQRRSAMKVGTDGVLLGAWAKGGQSILDIGTGTGVIALMMAQRFPSAEITGIEIDHDACLDARENIDASPFANRITLIETSFADYAKEKKEEAFDVVVSNPPYFDNSLENPDAARAKARHNSSLSFGELAKGAFDLLKKGGTFSVVLPTESIKLFSAECAMSGFCLLRHTAVKTVPRKTARRHLLTFVKPLTTNTDIPFVEEEIILTNSDGSRSEWYSELTKEFYLKK